VVRKILSLWWVSFFLFSTLQAQETNLLQKDDSMIVNSGEAQYNGKEIVLVGQVVVQHSLGQISARRLSVQPSVKDKKNKFNFLKVSEDVQIQFKGGGELYCQQAEVDYTKMQGVFWGNAVQPDVTYLNAGEEKVGEKRARPPFELRSSQMILELMREPASAASSAKTLIKQVEADQNVRVRYNQDHVLLADHALYQRMPDDRTSSIAGLLTLTVKENLPACKMTNLNGDHLSAHMIQVNTVERKLWLSQPIGMLYMRREAHPTQTVEFSSHELVWDDQQQNLLLRGQVNINQNDSLHLHTDHELFIAQAMVEGKKTLRFLQAPKETHISYSDAQKGNMHKIYCPGSFTIDHERQEMTLHGSLDPSEQHRSENHQVYIEDVLGEMYADQVHINYTWKDRQLVPEKMVLEGHVRLMNRFDGHLEEAGSILHYALADRVECFPKQQEMFLTSANSNRVLFFDKVNNIQMSAPSLKVRHDASTQKDSIQGLGDVRFTFIEKEFEQLKSHFPFQKELKDAKSGKK
jgi:hypothetical protein